MSDPQQRFMTPRERVADDVYLALLNAADDYADGDLVVGNLNALHAAVMAEVLPVLEQLEAAIERARQMAQVWVDIRPTSPTASDAGHGVAYAGQQILDALAAPEAPGGES